MKRVASLLGIATIIMVAGTVELAAPAQAQEPVFELSEADSPRAPVEIDVAARSEELEDGAWTFRFLVPTALVISAIILVLVAGGYGVGVRGRYRVKK